MATAQSTDFHPDPSYLELRAEESEAHEAAVASLAQPHTFAAAQEFPLPPEKIQEFERYCRNVVGYKLDDFPPGMCKRGTRRESHCRVLGPFNIEGKTVFDTGSGKAYSYVRITNGRWQANSTKEDASACVGKGELHGNLQGSWNLLVKKGLGIPDERTHNASNDHDDDYGRHAHIAADDMCRKIIKYIYDHLF